MSERERFEKWARGDHNLGTLTRYGNKAETYLDPYIAGQWSAWQAAIQSERERCAKIAETYDCGDFDCCHAEQAIADAIRRGEGGV